MKSLLFTFQFNEAKNRRLFYVILFLCQYPIQAKAQKPTIVFTEQYIAIQKDIYSLLLEKSSISISNELDKSPNNYAGYCLKDNALFLQSFISESELDLKLFTTQHQNLVSKLKLVDDSNPYKGYFIAETYTHKALVNFKAGNHYTAALALKEAHKWLIANKNRHPGFMPTYKNLALFEVGAANMVEGYSWLLNMVGINRNYQNSLALAEKFSKGAFSNELEIIRKETAFTLAYIHKQLLHDTKSMDLIKANTLDYKTNPLALYFLSTFAYKSGLNDRALEYMSAFKPQENQMQIPFLHYLKGVCLLNKLDANSYNSFSNYIKLHKGNNYIKSCYLKMAWAKLLINDTKGYALCMQQITKKGTLNTEEDKQARTEFNRNVMPNTHLLKSRLLFDGGYYEQSLLQLKGLKASDFSGALFQTEYCYRKARLYHILEDTKLAIAFYEATISTGKALNVYYASYSCIYLGDIYAQNGEKRKAVDYYTQSMTFNANEEYRNSIEQRAKNSLRKIKL